MHDVYALFEILYYYYMRQIYICVIENPRFINNIMLILMVGRSFTDSYKTGDLEPGVILT